MILDRLLDLLYRLCGQSFKGPDALADLEREENEKEEDSFDA